MSKQFCIIEPIAITGAVLVGSNVAENDHPAWVFGTFTVGNRRILTSTHRIYECQVAHTSVDASGSPHLNLTGATPQWLDVGPTNAYAMIDGKVNTQTSNADSIVLTVTPGQIARGVALLNVDADSVTLKVTDPVDGVVLLETKSAIRSTSNASFYRWSFTRIRKRTLFTWTNLPPCYAATIEITISKPGGTAKLGMAIVGPVEEIGFAQFGISPEIKDYSLNQFDSFGTPTSTERAWAKRLAVSVAVDNALVDDLQLLLASYRAKFLVWVASEQYESTVLYARYSGFKIVISRPTRSEANLNLDGGI